MNINTNIASIKTQSYLNTNQLSLEQAMERLSSGKRINTAADDAAGLSITSRMTTQVRGKEVAMRNANDGISLIQTGESALGSIGNILQRMRELAVQADNGTYSGADKTALQSEMKQLNDEIQNIANNTHFNGIKLLDGSGGTITLHIGDGATDVLTFAMNDANNDVIGGYDYTNKVADGGTGFATATAIYLEDIDITDNTTWVAAGFTGAQLAINVIDSALNQISQKRAELGATQNRLEFSIDNLNASKTNTEAARSRIEDADMATESSNMSKQKVLVQASIAMLSQANQSPENVLQLLQGN